MVNYSEGLNIMPDTELTLLAKFVLITYIHIRPLS